MRTRTGFRSALSLAVLVTGVLAANNASAAKKGGTLTIGMEAEFSGFNHAKAKIFNQNTTAPASAVMETLFVYEGDKIVPRLALELTEAPDRMSATVALRRGVKFHDGTPFNADAVVHHYSWLLDPKTGVNTSMLAPVRSVEKIDDYTVRFVLKSPWTALRSALALENLVNLIGSPTALKQDPEGFHRLPIGTGPFVFKEWRTGDRVVMERNPDYWDKNLPHLERVVYRVLPDANTRYQSIKSGEVDIGRVDVAGHILEAKKDPSLKVYEHEGAGGIMWNFNHSKEPFNDQRVRAAVVHSFNTKVMIDNYFLGLMHPTTGIIGTSQEWNCPTLNWRQYDLTKAKELVKDIGKPIKFELVTTNTPAGRRQATMVQQFIRAAGMETELRLVEQSNNVRVGLSGDYQMDVWRYSDIGGDPDLVLSYYFGGDRPVTRHDTSKLDPLLAKARSESDPKKRQEMYCQAQQIISDEAIALIPVRVSYFAVAGPKVNDLPPMVNSNIRVRTMWKE